MTPNDDTAAARADRWARAKDLFSNLVALPAHERAMALDTQCGGDAELRRFVESLLAADADYAETRDDPMLRDVHAALDRLASGVVRGRRFGAFAVVEEIGRGGMGVVYLAERHDGKVAQRVALKLVASGHLDADASARLARERRLLATLEHANIARLIDAGEDPGGIPYFAMEYVNGLPITRWCDERRLALVDRLRLFREVCAAVQYAHANLVVHCDLKAGNILVTDDGQPKLVDFGIATTLGVEAADAERRFLSPRSAAPEQFLGQPTSVATDVYALGVLLCELAGGSLPFDGDASVLVERVLHDAPRLPSEAAPERRRQLRGDIDAIVAKALAKAPHERYASVADLDADVAAYLATRPISIRAGERGYRARLFVRRNALPVALTAVLALSVIGFGVFTLRQNERLVHERDQAQLERARALQVTDFVVGLFNAAKPEEARGREVTARQLLERGRQQLGEALTEQPQLKAAMLAAIAEASFSLDDLQGGYLAARESLALLENLPSPPGRELASNLATLIRLENEFGRYAEALKYEERALALADQMDVSWRAEFAVQRAVTLYALARNKEATQVLRDALALLEKEVALGDSRIVRVAVRLAIRLPGIEGEKLLAKYLPQDMGGLNRDDPLYGDLLVAVAIYWRTRGDFDRAEKFAEDAVSAIARIYGENSSRITTAMNTLATIYHRRGDNEGSVRILMKALATLRRAYGETPNSARIEHNIGAILVDMGRVEEGLPYLERAVAIGTKSMSPDAHMLAFLRQELGWVLRDQRRYDEAEVMLRMALATYERDNNIGSQVDVRANLGCIAVERDRKTGLKGEISAAIEILEKEKEPNRTGIASLRRCLDIAT